MSLKRRITLTICSMIILLLTLISYIIYNKSASIINKDAEAYMESQLDRAQENIDLLIKINQLETEKLSLDLNVKSFLDHKMSVRALNNHLTAMMQEKNNSSNYYMDLFIINKEGHIVATTMPSAMDLDLSTRKYFQEAKDFKKTVTSDILTAKSDGSLIIITVSPIINDAKQVIAYAGTAIYAEFLSNFIKTFELGKIGYYVIIDSNNLILSHPNEKLIATQATNINYDIPDEFRLNRQTKVISTINKKHFFNNNGSKELQMYKLIESNNWVLTAVLPESELREKSLSLLIYVIVIGILVTILAVFIGTYISDKISIPIVAITRYINHAARSSLLISKSISDSINGFKDPEEHFVHDHHENHVKPDDEIGNLTRSFKNLKEYLASAVHQFNDESEQLIKTSQELSYTIEATSGRTAKFISVLSHDLKTSITLIKGYAKGILSGIIDSDEVKSRFLEGIYNSAEDIERITCDILDSAYEAQNIPKLYTEKVDMKKFASKLFETAKQYAKDSQRQFEGLLLCEEGMLLIDSIKISRVWNNLLNNAVKFSHEGSKIQVHIIQENNKITFKIIDEGIGIATDDMDKIFDIFYTGQYDDKKGYGLGLFIAKSFIEAHDSKLYFTSQLQKGSTFWFSLDIREDI
ncbi:signal transduction histidine kinase [Anaerosolibacter carboniphilus]|uniref:histidine kinase n=2 Tax=Anaerosolibacter carboniphilus TaxID=1417629 RepID=A0A841KV76_9FIRM|nr:signal transduction histidine kinase [Anaerosolibacter carboniphilus]